MPTYEYACTECGEQLEVVQSFTDDALTVCPACKGKLRKVFSPVGVVFKGSGFYKTDSRAKSNGAKVGANGESAKSSESGGDSSSTSSDSSGSSGSSDSAGKGSSDSKSASSAESGAAKSGSNEGSKSGAKRSERSAPKGGGSKVA
jgi:putative FmdB family regulatory protein